MAESIHTARWINQLAGRGWDIYLFPVSQLAGVHPDLRDVTIYSHSNRIPLGGHPSLRVKSFWGHLHSGAARQPVLCPNGLRISWTPHAGWPGSFANFSQTCSIRSSFSTLVISHWRPANFWEGRSLPGS